MIIDIVIFLVVFGLLGGLIYLLYWPFKRRLLKSGKLTKKNSRQINWFYIISICLICIILFFFRDYRTPSHTRLESVSDIELPSNYKVIKDEYQDMWQDYCIKFEIQLDSMSTKELIKSIKESKFYNPKANNDGLWDDSDFIIIDLDKAAWVKSINGYEFNKPYDRTTYYITLDTLTNKLLYNECAD